MFAAFCVMAYSNSSKEEKEDRLKLAFSLASLESGDPFAVNTHLDVDMMDAIRWFRLNNLHLSCVVFRSSGGKWGVAAMPSLLKEKR